MAVTPQMGLSLGLLVVALVMYSAEWVAVEVVSAGLLAVMLIAFQVLPVLGPDGANLLPPDRLLGGFGNPALITVMALLVVAEALTRTGALDRLAERMAALRLPPRLTIVLVLLLVIAHGTVIGDTSVVVMFLPLMQALALRLRLAPGRVMLPLSFSAVLGGMLTLIGSSTNLMVSSTLIAIGQPPLGFFDQTAMALPLVAAGTLYILLVMPRLLPKGGDVGDTSGGGKQFISQLHIHPDHPLVGENAVAGMFPSLPGITIHLLLRGGVRSSYPPYDDGPLEAGDVLIIAGPRKALSDLAARFPGLLEPPMENGASDTSGDDDRTRSRRDLSADELVMVEAMVPPGSPVVGMTVGSAGIERNGLRVAGIERRARMLRRALSSIALQPGDVLLLLGRWPEIDAVRGERDVVVVAGSVGPVPKVHHTTFAALVFLSAVGLSAAGVVPISVAAVTATAILVAGGALTPRQAIRSIDARVVLLVGSALALSEALQVTGGAAAIAQTMLGVLGTAAPLPALAAYFGLVAAVTNVLSHNACALLFTPVGVGIAHHLGLDPHMFAIATVLAANCSFITPIGHQVNLLVMGPGHYRFVDYVRAGLPLVLLLWGVFILAAKLEWGL
jgi:di/tricarboxylate transporter